MIRKRLLSLLVLFVLAGCSQFVTDGGQKNLELKIKLTMLEERRVSISAGMHNPGKRDVPQDDSFVGEFALLDKAGNLVNDGKVYGFSSLAGGETSYPYMYELTLEPGAYTVVFSAQDVEPVEVDFEIIEEAGHVYLNAPQENIDPFTQFIYSQAP